MYILYRAILKYAAQSGCSSFFGRNLLLKIRLSRSGYLRLSVVIVSFIADEVVENDLSFIYLLVYVLSVCWFIITLKLKIINERINY